jgi:hypothetical protein
LSLLGQNLFNLLGEVLVLDFLVIEVFGAFGGIVYDVRDLFIFRLQFSTLVLTRKAVVAHLLLVHRVLACLGQARTQKMITERLMVLLKFHSSLGGIWGRC